VKATPDTAGNAKDIQGSDSGAKRQQSGELKRKGWVSNGSVVATTQRTTFSSWRDAKSRVGISGRRG